MEKSAKIFVAGHRGMVGSAIVKDLQSRGFNNIVTRTSTELNLIDQKAVSREKNGNAKLRNNSIPNKRAVPSAISEYPEKSP